MGKHQNQNKEANLNTPFSLKAATQAIPTAHPTEEVYRYAPPSPHFKYQPFW